MIRHVLIGLFAAVVAIVVVAVAQPKEQPPLSFDPPVVKIDDIATFLPKPEALRRPSATRPANPLEKPIPEVNLDNATLADALEFLRDVTRANLVVNWRALEAAGIERNATVSVKLRDATADAVLSAVLDGAAGGNVVLQHRYQNNILYVSTAEDLSANTEIRLYNVRDLMINAMRFHRSFDHAARAGNPVTSRATDSAANGGVTAVTWYEGDLAAQLQSLITNTVIPDTWVDNGGRFGACHYWAGKFLIVQTPEAHEEIERFLNLLREE